MSLTERSKTNNYYLYQIYKVEYIRSPFFEVLLTKRNFLLIMLNKIVVASLEPFPTPKPESSLVVKTAHYW